MNGADRIIFALDVPDEANALKWVERLGKRVGLYKIGLELFVAAGPGLVKKIAGAGHGVFLDLKFHDIPNTMAGAVRSAGGFGASIINVHALAGLDGMKKAAEAARTFGEKRPKVIAVTILTSHGPDTLNQLGLDGPPGEAVARLAGLAREAGLDGVVCSPVEAAAVRKMWSGALIVTPGVRPIGADAGDQVRTATPGGAITSGADLLVIGRPISGATDPLGAAGEIAAEIGEALKGLAP